MIKVDTGIPIVHRFDDVADQATCDLIYQNFLQVHGVNHDPDTNKLPWFENNTQNWWMLPDINMRRLVNEQRQKITRLVASAFNTMVYPTFTDLVLWRPGKQMAKHKDNGYAGQTHLFHRTHTSVMYLNSGYQGGETFIETEWGRYLSTPRIGSMVCFPSDESAEHGVTQVQGGLRLTLSIWFCTQAQHCEDTVHSNQIRL